MYSLCYGYEYLLMLSEVFYQYNPLHSNFLHSLEQIL